MREPYLAVVFCKEHEHVHNNHIDFMLFLAFDNRITCKLCQFNNVWQIFFSPSRSRVDDVIGSNQTHGRVTHAHIQEQNVTSINFQVLLLQRSRGSCPRHFRGVRTKQCRKSVAKLKRHDAVDDEVDAAVEQHQDVHRISQWHVDL